MARRRRLLLVYKNIWGDEITVAATGIKGKNFKASTNNFAQTIDGEENERRRHKIFHIRVISKH